MGENSILDINKNSCNWLNGTGFHITG